MAATSDRVSATSGVLLRLRKQLEFIQNGKDILEMKRDHLAAEINKYLQTLSTIREETEKSLADAYEYLKIAYSKLGYSGLSSSASSVSPLDFKTSMRSVMGVEIPVITDFSGESGTADFTNVPEPTAQQAAEKLRLSLEKLLKMAEVEVSVERIATELMMTNRKVNSLENTVIPRITRLITDIEEQLEEEDLEEFFKAKKMRSTIRSKGR